MTTGALLWMHGGGHLSGAPEQDDRTNIAFARELGIVVAAVRYRLGVTAPAPASVEDCYAALQALASRSAEWGVNPHRSRHLERAHLDPEEQPSRLVDLPRQRAGGCGCLPHRRARRVGFDDLFYTEDLEYARRLTEAGVPCDVFTVPGAFHGFDALFTKAPITRTFWEHQAAALRAAGVA